MATKQNESTIETGAAQNTPDASQAAPDKAQAAPDTAQAVSARSDQTRSRSHRFALRAGSVALAAALGAVVGSVGMSTAQRLLPGASVQEATAEEHRLKDSIGQLAAEVSTLKASVEALSKSTGGRTTAAPEGTGSVPSAPTESKTSKEVPKPRIVEGWILRDVYRGRIALLENRYRMYAVEPGLIVPGVGRVERIKRQDGRWVVVTAKGLITSYR